MYGGMNDPDEISEGEYLSDLLDDGGAIQHHVNRLLTPPLQASTRNAKPTPNAQYTANKAAKVGSTCACPTCGTNFTKKSYQQAFCQNKKKKCKDKFWNSQPGRISRTIAFNV